MNALRQAQTAYRSETQPIRTHRGIEYEAFARVTHRLKSAAPGGRTAMRDLAAAVHDNRLLWATLAADVAGEGNALPPELRARILYLAEFTRLHSSKVLAGAAPDSLIEINSAVMRGLRDRSPAR